VLQLHTVNVAYGFMVQTLSADLAFMLSVTVQSRLYIRCQEQTEGPSLVSNTDKEQHRTQHGPHVADCMNSVILLI
jgi:hypothetical protein